MRLVVGIPEPLISKRVLEPIAEAVTRLSEDQIRNGTVPTFRDALGRGMVRWQPEAPGEERFDHAKTVVDRGHGDCDDIAPWEAASLRATGEDPGARAIAVQRTPTLWHMMVQKSDGTIKDPSIDAGMPTRGARAHAPAVATMTQATVVGGIKRPTVAIRPLLHVRPGVRHCVVVGWEARADLPLSNTNAALVNLARAGVASQAIIGACDGACEVADHAQTMIEPETATPVEAIAGLLSGHSSDEVDAICGELARHRAEEWLDRSEVVCGDLFGDIAHAVSHVVKDVGHAIDSVSHTLQPVLDIGKQVLSAAQGVVSLIPGVGTGISAAISAGLALVSGGTPLEIAVRTAYGAIPIPPGVRNVTDTVLDAVLQLAKGGDVGEAAVAAVRGRFPKGIIQDVFDTLIHIVAASLFKKPTHAIATPRPGVPPGSPVQLVRRKITAPAVRVAPPHIIHSSPNPIHLTTHVRSQAGPRIVSRVPVATSRPGWMHNLPPHALWVPPAGLAFGR